MNTINILDKTVQIISVSSPIDVSLFNNVLDVDTIYSYIIYNEFDEDRLISWRIEYSVSQTPEYNTLHVSDVYNQIIAILLSTLNDQDIGYVAGYKQPPSDVMLQLYNPLIQSLAHKITRQWRKIDYDDAYQICALTMCTLYKKGYYVNKKLLERSFINTILCMSKSERYAPPMISIDNNVTDNGDIINYGDVIEDLALTAQMHDDDVQEIRYLIFEEVKEIIIDYIGERQWDQLLRDYSYRGSTSSWSQHRMLDIKRYLKANGIDKNYFSRKYFQ